MTAPSSSPSTPPPSTTPTAVFGYGSLIFKPPPYPTITSESGYIKGFIRRFAQDSHDHRGTPEFPGRVVTLVTEKDWAPFRRDEPTGDGHVWGQIYRIPPSEAEAIWAYLDHREKDGYTLRTVDVYGVGKDGEEIVVEKDCKVYVGETDNPSFGQATPMLDLADRIARSQGPSGPNKEYLFKLCDAVKHLCSSAHDLYLIELERLVRKRELELEDERKTVPSQ